MIIYYLLAALVIGIICTAPSAFSWCLLFFLILIINFEIINFIRKSLMKQKHKQEPLKLLSCPFCNKSGFDKPGLKSHLKHIDCEEYHEVNETPRMFYTSYS